MSAPALPGRRLGAGAWRRLERRAAAAHVAGAELNDALAVLERAGRRGLAGTVAFWDDARDSVDDVYARCLDAAGALHDRPRTYLSLKAPALGFDAARVSALAARGAPLHLDSLSAAAADRNLQLAERMSAQGVKIGVTLPGRWRRSLDDLTRAVALGTRIRVVKGEWPDPDGGDLDPRRGVLGLVTRLAGAAGPVAVASHDSRLVDEALGILLAAGSAAEVEILLAHPHRRVLAVARRRRVPVRLYAPYGRPWLPWSVGDVRRRPWLLARISRSALISLAR